MLKSHEKFHSVNGKRQVLIAEDESINRELLGAFLEDEYDVLYAENGREAMQLLQDHKKTISIVLLDLQMPEVDGLEVLRFVKTDAELSKIPVIVMTADDRSEVECLNEGALDFIPKPYPNQEVVKARVARTIEFSEERLTIQAVERDRLTGLYNKEFFLQYAEQYDNFHLDKPMDAIIVDVNHFRMINDRFGASYGDEILKDVGAKLREMVGRDGGMVCRKEADTFMIYVPHIEDYHSRLEGLAGSLTAREVSGNRIRFRMGVYPNVDKEIAIERRFDRAKMAADTVKNSFTKTIGIYDKALHDRELYAEQLIEDFHKAIDERQFVVYYQPKFDIRPEIPVLASAEALVRWQHPQLGMISPGVFIPLFEDNGLIRSLDHYVWETAAAQIKEWKETFDFSVPVSVNVSRIDMYDPNLIDTFTSIIEGNGLETSELLLEITESAYTQDSGQIIETVNRLRALGFKIEMDDFGTGYSSLNMISTLPIDTLKLDMRFIRTAFSENGNTRMLEVIMDIAEYLGVPTIAEGVETEEQLRVLKDMGCDLVQGYYFSKPVPADEYEAFVVKRKELSHVIPLGDIAKKKEEKQEYAFGRIAHALSSGFESIYYVDTESDHYIEFSSEGRYEDLQIEKSGADFFGDTQRNIARVVYAEDRPRVSLCMQKDALMAQLSDGAPYSMTYRLLMDGVPTYYNLKIVRASTHDDHHIVIGVSNVDAQMKEARESQEAANELNFQSLANALASDMESLYYVDTLSDTYMEFVSDGSYGELKLEITGSHFFDECRKNISEVVYEEDQDKVQMALEKKALLAALQGGQAFTMDYRLLIDGKPVYYRMKACHAEAGADDHIIIGVSNIDAQITEEQKLESERQSVAAYSRIAQALARDYFSIYYVDTETDHFIEYSSYDEYADLGIEKSGEDFFNLSRVNIERVGHPDDIGPFLESFTKEKVLAELDRNGTFTTSYRLMFNGVSNYVSMKATRMGDRNDHHIVIGVNNIDAQMLREQEYQKTLEQNLTYSRIAQALSRDYYSIYYVNIETDEFIEYSSNGEYEELKVEQSGQDFFEDCRRNILRLVYHDDLDKALAVWDKNQLLPQLESGDVFSTTYRLMMAGAPVYINCKVIRMDDDQGDRHIVIGVSNVDAQMQRENELLVAQERANRDPLTGVKSKHAFDEAEAEWNARIASGDAAEFAIVVCDVNGLKEVNDQHGHKAGDIHIQKACRRICKVFQHSPVYRIGGDEFVAILSGQDCENRAQLLQSMQEKNREENNEGVTVACGISLYTKDDDQQFESIFKRADAAMYENKRQLKGICR